ncbi:MAG: DUF434 domain-containing protein [Crocinitomix sp.]|nr:DUF434 domain-containing protein [Crocinitomix sp.]
MNELLTKGYAINASLNLVGNHYRLNKRQQDALRRACASKIQINHIVSKEIDESDVKGKTILIDGFNLIISLESALSGGYVFKCADGTYRDLSGVHGTYKRVKQTNQALKLIGETLRLLEPQKVVWILDKPVSNSGRLKTLILEMAAELDSSWEVILDNNPDAYIVAKDEVAISADGWIIEQVNWFNLAGFIIENKINEAEVFDFNKIANGK